MIIEFLGLMAVLWGIEKAEDRARQQVRVSKAPAPVIVEKPLDHMPFIEPNSFVPVIGYSGY